VRLHPDAPMGQQRRQPGDRRTRGLAVLVAGIRRHLACRLAPLSWAAGWAIGLAAGLVAGSWPRPAGLRRRQRSLAQSWQRQAQTNSQAALMAQTNGASIHHLQPGRPTPLRIQVASNGDGGEAKPIRYSAPAQAGAGQGFAHLGQITLRSGIPRGCRCRWDTGRGREQAR